MLESVTGVLVAKVLDLSWLNHTILASNVAGNNMENYQPRRLDFEGALREMSSISSGITSASDLKDRLGSDVLLQHVTYADDGDQPVDSLMYDVTRNTMFYQALLAARSSYGEIVASAISGGRA